MVFARFPCRRTMSNHTRGCMSAFAEPTLYYSLAKPTALIARVLGVQHVVVTVVHIRPAFEEIEAGQKICEMPLSQAADGPTCCSPVLRARLRRYRLGPSSLSGSVSPSIGPPRALRVFGVIVQRGVWGSYLLVFTSNIYSWHVAFRSILLARRWL
jgi:hypothetical protein